MESDDGDGGGGFDNVRWGRLVILIFWWGGGGKKELIMIGYGIVWCGGIVGLFGWLARLFHGWVRETGRRKV